VVTLDKTNFASMTRVAGRVSMVEFYSPASLACQALDSSVEGIARRYGGKAVIAKVNFSQDDALKAEWDVWILPTFLFLNGGREVKRIVQPSGGDSLVMVLDSLLAPGSK
jgi:thioredoxin-like negative regulator of GroEL